MFRSYLNDILCCCLLVVCLPGCKRDIPVPPSAGRILPSGIIEFHVLANRSLDISHDFDRIADAFKTEGSESSPDGLRWLEVAVAEATEIEHLVPRDMVLAHQQDRLFVLASTAPESSLDARAEWQVVDFRYEQTHPRGSTLVFELDGSGAEQMTRLTQANLKRRVAVSVFGKVHSVATIMEEVGGFVSIHGAPEDIAPLHQRLEEACASNQDSRSSGP